jgi:4-aminobutyrate aminotransferase-like enzyme
MKYARVVTELPHPLDIKLLDDINKYEANSMQGQIPIIWDKAEDFIVYDRHGNQFLDFTSGICVANCGHGNVDIMNDIRRKINRPLAHSYTFGTEIRYKFLKELVNTCYPKGKAFLVSAGTEATEVACKLMRMYGQGKNSNNRIIVSFNGSMHGRTMLAEQLKGINKENLWAYSFDKSVIHLDGINKDTSYKNWNTKEICGIIIESYQGWSAKFYDKKYIQDLVIWARSNDILVCFDEIQGGFGRTGKMWAWEHYEIEQPDLICFGKGVSSSVPLSGVIGNQGIIDIPDYGAMSSTHSANPVSCAAGLANLQYLKKHNLIENSRKLGKIMIEFLSNLGLKVQGNGLLCAIITENEKEADKIVMECFKKGLLLIRTHRTSVKLAPPLTINLDGLKEGLNIIKEVVKK